MVHNMAELAHYYIKYIMYNVGHVIYVLRDF